MGAIAVEATTTIEAPPERVWAFVSDPSRYSEWSVVTEEMTELDRGAVSEGFQYSEIGGLGPMTGESEWTVTEFDPPCRQVHEGDDGTVTTMLTIELEPIEDGGSTRLDQRIELGFPRGYRLLARLVGVLFLRRMATSALEGTVQNAKRIIETEQAVTG